MPGGSLLTLPNLISLSRLFLAPAFFVLPRVEARVALVIAAAASDMLDGWLARRLGSKSRFGAILDPVADRVFVLTALLALVLHGTLSPAQVAIVLSRDVMTTLGFFVASSVSWLRPVEFRARKPGKLVTVLQMLTLLVALMIPARAGMMVVLTGLASVVAVADYTMVLWRERVR